MIAVDCEKTEFDEFSECSVTCGGGTRIRTRRIVVNPKNGGLPCVGEDREEDKCNTNPCPIDCKVGEYKCSNCNKFTGKKVCTRPVLTKAQHVSFRSFFFLFSSFFCFQGGKKCPSLSKVEKCRVDCEVTPWGKWTTCSKKCGGGVQYRTRKKVYGAQNGGTDCPKLKDSRDCNTQPCRKLHTHVQLLHI